MAKYKLILEEDYDFDLIGICSSHADYRLTWSLNQAVGIQLEKVDDYVVRNKKKEDDLYSFYSYYSEEDHAEYFLIRNVSNNFTYLIPEKDQVDYFLIIKDPSGDGPSRILDRIKQSDSVLTAFIFEADELKSRANLIF